jgi:hypothetical protein
MLKRSVAQHLIVRDGLLGGLKRLDNVARRPRDAGLVLLRTIGGALTEPICQSVARPELLEEAHDVVATLPAARRAFDAQHVELADQSADRSVAGRVFADQLGDCSACLIIDSISRSTK